MPVSFELPQNLQVEIENQLLKLGFSLQHPEKLAPAIMELSDHFQSQSSQTPWGESTKKAAYLIYFLPLNYIRCLKVISEASSWDFFDEITDITDFGCGPGTLSLALKHSLGLDSQAFTGVDCLSETKELFQELLPGAQWQNALDSSSSRQQLFAASYTLNELSKPPLEIASYEKLLIIEPSTRQNFPGLLGLRQNLIEQGFQILAPCPHHNQCPLAGSKKDWCHDRVHWKQPTWFTELEKHLPIKNKTMSFSYLLASKTLHKSINYMRLVGDALKEKGKTRWMLCRESEREFLSFLKKQGKAPELNRGDKINLKDFEKKGSEIRFQADHLKTLS